MACRRACRCCFYRAQKTGIVSRETAANGGFSRLRRGGTDRLQALKHCICAEQKSSPGVTRFGLNFRFSSEQRRARGIESEIWSGFRRQRRAESGEDREVFEGWFKR